VAAAFRLGHALAQVTGVGDRRNGQTIYRRREKGRIFFLLQEKGEGLF
jgi:hypothetical protein